MKHASGFLLASKDKKHLPQGSPGTGLIACLRSACSVPGFTQKTQSGLWPGKAAIGGSSQAARLGEWHAHLLINSPGDAKEAVAVVWNLTT